MGCNKKANHQQICGFNLINVQHLKTSIEKLDIETIKQNNGNDSSGHTLTKSGSESTTSKHTPEKSVKSTQESAKSWSQEKGMFQTIIIFCKNCLIKTK